MSFIVPIPPNPSDSQFKGNQPLFNSRQMEWMSVLKGRLEQSKSLTNGIAIQSPVAGDMAYYANNLGWSRLVGGTAGQVLTYGTGTAPAWGNISSNLVAGSNITLTGTSTVTIALGTNAKAKDISFSLDGEGVAIVSGGTWYQADIPYTGTITSWSLVADQSGSIVIDVWKANAAVPTVANTITASSLPTLSSAQSAFNGSISGWTTAVSAGDVFAFHVNSASTVTKASLTLRVTL